MKILNTSVPKADFWIGGLNPRFPEAGVEIVDAHLAPEEKLVEEVRDADILIGDYTFNTPITARVVNAAKQLKLVQQPSVGYNQIDIAACTKRGIPVANTPGANDIGVAEHTVMLALACLKKLPLFNAATHRGEWLFPARQRIGVFEIDGKTYGLVGMGRTGRETARRLVPFGVKALYYDVVRLTPEEEARYGARFAPLEEILKTADVISIHLPLTTETRGIIDAEKLALMKPTAFLINVGRGELVVESALAEAVRSGKLAGAAADVFSTEPPPKDHPFFGLENMILTPHLAGSTRESGARIMGMALDNIVRILKGEKPLWVLNQKS